MEKDDNLNKRLKLLIDSGKRFNLISRIRDLLKITLDEFILNIPAPNGFVYLQDEDFFYVHSGETVPSDVRIPEDDFIHSGIWSILQKGVPQQVSLDILRDMIPLSPDDELNNDSLPPSVLVVPLIDDTQDVFGMVLILRPENEEFSLEDREIANLLVPYSSHVYSTIKIQSALRQREDLFGHAQRLEALGRLAGGVAHDFNNLLTAIIGYCELIELDSKPGSELNRNIIDLKGMVLQGSSLTKQLLAFSRKQTREPMQINIVEITDTMKRMLPRLLGENIDVSISTAGDTSVIVADPNQLSQILINLSINARDAMPDGGQLNIKTRNLIISETEQKYPHVLPGEYIELSVGDNGRGISPDHIDQIFDPFFTTKTESGGTGLGLATVLGIVEQNSGHIFVDSNPDKGTLFTLLFPAVQEHQDDICDTDQDIPMLHLQGSVMVVEDNRAIRGLVGKLLTQKGFNTLCAENGRDALELYQSSDIELDLVITDLLMPELGGVELVRALRQQQPHLKVLFMSGYAGDLQDMPSDLQSEELDYIQKPFLIPDLLKKVQDLLN